MRKINTGSAGAAAGGGFAQSAALTISNPDASTQQLDAAWRAVDDAEFFPQVVAALSGVTVTQPTATLAFADSADALALASSETMRDYINSSDYLIGLLAPDAAIWEYCFVNPEKIFIRYSSDPVGMFDGIVDENLLLNPKNILMSNDGEYIGLYQNTTADGFAVLKTKYKNEFAYSQLVGFTSSFTSTTGAWCWVGDKNDGILVANGTSSTATGTQYQFVAEGDPTGMLGQTTGALNTLGFSNGIAQGGGDIVVCMDNSRNPFLVQVSYDQASSTQQYDVETAITTDFEFCAMSRDGKYLMYPVSSSFSLRELNQPYEVDGGGTTRSINSVPARFTIGWGGATASKCGNHLFVAASTSDSIGRYDMTTPNDFRTLYCPNGWGTAYTNSGSAHASWEDLFLKPDGTTIYGISDASGADVIIEFPLTVTGQVHTFGSETSTAIPGSPTPRAFTFKPDGTEVYIIDSSNILRTYPLSTAWDSSSIGAATDTSFTLSGLLQSGFQFNEDGTKLVGSQNGDIVSYDLSTPYRASTAGSATTTFLISTALGTSLIFRFSENGRYALGINGASNPKQMFWVKCSTPFDASTAEVIWQGSSRYLGISVPGKPQIARDFSVIYSNNNSAIQSYKTEPKVFAP